MRCSKCGYISFDHLDSCRKCHKPMAEAELKGTTYPVIVPLFLQLSQETNTSGLEEEIVDILDPDLDLLAGGDDEVIDFGDNMVEHQNIARNEAQLSGGGDITLGDDFEIAFDSDINGTDLSLDEEDLFIDTSRFEDVPINIQAARPVQLEIPEELADISDLARPASGAEVKSGLDARFDYDDLQLDDLDLSFGGQKASDSDSPAEENDLADLSLDDIDLSGGLEVVPLQSAPRPVNDDLDFDLDLGAVGEVDGESRKKASDDLSDFTLSLE